MKATLFYKPLPGQCVELGGVPPGFTSFLGPQIVTLFGNRVVADVMKSYWSKVGLLSQYDWYAYEKK